MLLSRYVNDIAAFLWLLKFMNFDRLIEVK